MLCAAVNWSSGVGSRRTGVWTFRIGGEVDLPFFVGSFVGNFVGMKAVSEV
jgi:hypothetical protein